MTKVFKNESELVGSLLKQYWVNSQRWRLALVVPGTTVYGYKNGVSLKVICVSESEAKSMGTLWSWVYKKKAMEDLNLWINRGYSSFCMWDLVAK